MFNKIPVFFLFLLFSASCQSGEQYEKSTDPLDGGRNFIQNFMQGDVKKAHAYLLSDPENEAFFKQMTDQYFSLDKEGRSLLRQASIQINEVSAVDSTITIINYQTTTHPKAQKLKLIQTPDGWKVDLKYSYGPNL
jgi:fructose-1,6-bisphosphatase/inositol monophosphatase family enzyme